MTATLSRLSILAPLCCGLAAQSTWIQRTPGLPANQSEVALATDMQRLTQVYFVAAAAATGQPETWECRAWAWTKRLPTRTPKGPLVAMANDLARRCTWLVSGDPTRLTL